MKAQSETAARAAYRTVPTRRRVVARGEGDLAATGGPSSILIDV